MTRLLSLTRAAAVTVLTSGSLSALALSPNESIEQPAGTSLTTAPWLAGVIVEDTVVPFSYPGTLIIPGCACDSFGDVTGTVQSRVVKSVDGTFDFYWKISVDDTSFLQVTGFRLQGIPPAAYGAGWRTDLEGDERPAIIGMGSNGGVSFTFGGTGGSYFPGYDQLREGHDSRWLLLDSQATAYAASGTFSLTTYKFTYGLGDWYGDSGFYPMFAAAVPEPPAGVLAMLGLAGMAALSRWYGRPGRRAG